MKHVAPLLVVVLTFVSSTFAEVPQPATGPDSPEALSIPPLTAPTKPATPNPTPVARPKAQPDDVIVTKALALLDAGKLLTADTFIANSRLRNLAP